MALNYPSHTTEAPIEAIIVQLSGPYVLHQILMDELTVLNARGKLVAGSIYEIAQQKLELVADALTGEGAKYVWGLFMQAADRGTDKGVLLNTITGIDTNSLIAWNQQVSDQVTAIINVLLSDLRGNA